MLHEVLPRDRFELILFRIPAQRIAVIGDFFLDRYLVTDPGLAEISVETGLEARQVVQVRRSPGAAGTVTNNLSTLGVGSIAAYGVVGDDGEGYELRRALEATRVDTSALLSTPDRFTPTYMKPMVLEAGAERELERLDIKNRAPLGASLEDRLLSALGEELPRLSAVIIADQVQERNCGVITDRVRNELAKLAAAHPVLFFADSRMRIGEFRNTVIKPNLAEAGRALYPNRTGEPTVEDAGQIARFLSDSVGGSAVFLTLGADGILVCAGTEHLLPTRPLCHVSAPPVTGAIDICGAGDSATAGIVCALCAGATPEEAGAFGNLCASVTIRKLGTTGTASPDELREAWALARREDARPGE